MKLLLLLAFLSCSLPIPAQEEGGSDSSGLHLTSETALYSADINLKEGEATEEEKKDDKKRKSLGIGESVTITLGDKAFLMDPIKEIQWSIDQGKNLLKPVKDQELKGKTSLTLTVRPDLKKEDVKVKIQISVKVKKQEFSPAPIQFDVILPNKLTAQHIPSGDDAGSPVPGSYPSKEAWIGASMQLKISLGPTNVNFSNIQIIEKDGGENPPADTEGSLSGKHKADSVWEINNRHEFDRPDNIWAIIDRDKANNPNTRYPNTFVWKCYFKTTDGKKTTDKDNEEHINAFETVENVTQTFKVAQIRVGPGSRLNTQISKFSKKKCTVERTAGLPQYYYADDD